MPTGWLAVGAGNAKLVQVTDLAGLRCLALRRVSLKIPSATDPRTTNRDLAALLGHAILTYVPPSWPDVLFDVRQHPHAASVRRTLFVIDQRGVIHRSYTSMAK